jgi:hypothetical protein
MTLKRSGPVYGTFNILPPFANIKGWCQLTDMTETRTYDLLAIGLLRGKKLQKADGRNWRLGPGKCICPTPAATSPRSTAV